MAKGTTDRSSGKQKTGGAAASSTRDHASTPPVAMTPAAALARHLEWLDFALGAATAEQTWRRDRLAKATKRNRPKREDRLAEVVAEVAELTALLAGIRDLQKRAAPAAAGSGTKKPRSATIRSRTAATREAGPTDAKAGSPPVKTPIAAGAATSGPATKPAPTGPKPSASRAARPTSPAKKPRTRRGPGRPRQSPAAGGTPSAG